MRSPVVPRLAGLALGAVVLTLTASTTVPADLIIFKDGFIVQGKVQRQTELIRDPFTGEVFEVARIGGFYTIEADARRIIFPPGQVEDANYTDPHKAVDLVQLGKKQFLRRENLLIDYEVEGSGEFNSKWERTQEVFLPLRNARIKTPQRLVWLTPEYARVDFLNYHCDAYYLTRELGPDLARSLAKMWLDKQKDLKDETYKRLQLFNFLRQAGWLDHADKELDALLKAYPKEESLVREKREVLQKLKAMHLVDDLERAFRVGQYAEVQELLDRYAKDKLEPLVGEKLHVQVQVIKEKYETAVAKVKSMQAALKELPKRLAGSELGSFFAGAAKVIQEELNLDTLPRLETFLGQAEQYEREVKDKGKSTVLPQEVLSYAVTGWVLGNGSAEKNPDVARRFWRARKAALDYLKEQNADARLQIATKYAQSKGAIGTDEMSQLVRSLPPPQAEEKLPTGLVKVEVEGNGKKGLVYHLQLPPGYHHHRPHPVLMVLPNHGETPAQAIKGWSELTDQNGYILVTPIWGGEKSAYGYTAEEHAVVLQTLHHLRRRFQVDSDRVFLFGWGEAGQMAYDVGLSHPDQFAGVMPMSATPLKFAARYWPNGQYLPFYVVDGAGNSKSVDLNRKHFKEWIRCRYPSIYVEYKGRGRECFTGEFPIMMDWMNRKRRAHPMRQVGVPGDKNAFSQEFRTMRESDNRFYWLSTDAIQKACLNDPADFRERTPALMSAEIKATSNQIHMSVRGLKQITIWLGPGMVDFSRPVKVYFPSSRASASRKVTPSMETLLEDLFQRGDRQRLYLARLDFKL
jgi:hypothetical protein